MQNLKDYYNIDVIDRIAQWFKKNLETFEEEKFIRECLEWMQWLTLLWRSHFIAEKMNEFLPWWIEEKHNIIQKALTKDLIEPFSHMEISWIDSFIILPYWDFYSDFASEYPEISLKWLEKVTILSTAEFPIRTFILKHEEITFKYLEKWAKDKNHNLRRLVSEWTRPRLPWGQRLPKFQKNPRKVIELLEVLKNDSSEYVRRSVANNLNDIAKDNPDIVIETLKKWNKTPTPEIKYITSHSLRTLIKNWDKWALELLWYHWKAEVKSLIVDKPEINIWEEIKLESLIKNSSDKEINLVIDYKIHFIKANWKPAWKVFKWTKVKLKKDEEKILTKTHSFKIIWTRKYYEWVHKIEIQVNWEIVKETNFNLK